MKERDDSWVEVEPYYVCRIRGSDLYVDAVESPDGMMSWRSDVQRPLATELTRVQAYWLAGNIPRLKPVKVTPFRRFTRTDGSVLHKCKKETAS
jgi:hypothetical protein